MPLKSTKFFLEIRNVGDTRVCWASVSGGAGEIVFWSAICPSAQELVPAPSLYKVDLTGASEGEVSAFPGIHVQMDGTRKTQDGGRDHPNTRDPEVPLWVEGCVCLCEVPSLTPSSWKSSSRWLDLPPVCSTWGSFSD